MVPFKEILKEKHLQFTVYLRVLKYTVLFPNLFAGGGAAQGVSGPAVWGYLSGNGLLTAITLGRLAGEHAGKQASQSKA